MHDHGRTISLAKGPAATLGAAMLAYGVFAMAFGGTSFTTADVPDGPTGTGERFLALEGNGWTNALWIALEVCCCSPPPCTGWPGSPP